MTSDVRAQVLPAAPSAAASATRIALAVLYALVVLRCAWVSDDAFITLRTVDNLVHGLGATWNPAERVQAYTHPLWMLLLTAGYSVWPSAWGVALALSLALSFATVVLLARVAGGTPGRTALALALLALSRSYVDYSTSGLENPLTHLLIVAFAARLVAPGEGAARLRWLSVIAGLGALNRLDTLLIFLPALALEAWRCRAVPVRTRLGTLALGFLPLVLWELFSLVYYGSLVPNTAYAKLGTGLGAGELALQGLRYLTSSALYDPAGALVLCVGLLLALLRGRRTPLAPLALGGLLYLGYTVRVGGDFMAGRFLAAPLLCAVLALCTLEREPVARSALLLVVTALGLSLALDASPLTRGAADAASGHIMEVNGYGVADERSFYFTGTGLFREDGAYGVDHPWNDRGMLMQQRGVSLAVLGNIGFAGYAAGPHTHIVDPLGLADPLLSRLPTAPGEWRVGHYVRDIPAGYLESLEHGRNEVRDPSVAALWDCVSRVTRGPLFTRERWVAIWRLNTGGCRAPGA
ncbi:hypothetical protein FGE12_17710 [Aggregicoccus sp. 17bor-14]|uniref:hypothetical protein n=1 Tax=Myxococcaceae TaxID=31 RepID=UPI00129C7162|nr:MULTISPECIES: hypothetical protein [Myxococcaceae]MBF5044239.1 hypothetical protein [Simulacricoccus sp. 17bor-14]MRI89989.1 hypothetical protein [Aggregicoccus sp. 17bor-14]